MPKDNYRAGTGLGGKGKLSKQEKRQKKLDEKDEAIDADEGQEAAQRFLMKKESKSEDRINRKMKKKFPEGVDPNDPKAVRKALRIGAWGRDGKKED